MLLVLKLKRKNLKNSKEEKEIKSPRQVCHIFYLGHDKDVLIVAGGCGGSCSGAYNYTSGASFGGGTGGITPDRGHNLGLGGASPGQGENGSALAKSADRDSCRGGWVGGLAVNSLRPTGDNGPGRGGTGYIGSVPTVSYKNKSYVPQTISGNQPGFTKSTVGKAVITAIDIETGFNIYYGTKQVLEIYYGTKQVTDLFLGSISLK